MEIHFEDVSYWYGKGTPFEKMAIDHITLHIPYGQFIALMGETGSGKTTLAQMINGLILPDHGRIIVGPYQITNKTRNLRLLRAKIGYAFQYPEHQLFEETVYKDIAYGLTQQEVPQDLIPSRVKRAMELVGLSYEEIKGRSPFQLSGGQMRRVALAGVLATQPKILILDEPTAGLDPVGRMELLRLIKSMHQEEQITVIYITHHLEEALEYAERILILKHGKIHSDLYPADVIHSLSMIENAGILPTPLLTLISELNQKGIMLEKIYKEEDLVSALIQMGRRGVNGIH
jgi:energy-coupling factor transport system ATP-binding protein